MRGSVHAESPFYTTRGRKRRRTRSTTLLVVVAAGTLALLAVLFGLAYAGSRQELAEGTHVAGVDVGGMTKREAVTLLQGRFERVAGKPVVFVAGDESYRFAANQLAVQPDWSSAITAASRASDGFGPIRGFRRLRTRVFGAEVLPQLAVSNGALEFALEKVAADVNAKPVDAALVRRGLRIRMVEEQTGTRLDHDRAAETIVRALGKIERSQAATALPVLVTAPKVTSEMLLPAARRARRAVSAPVVLEGTTRRWRIPRWRVAQLLALPRGGATRLTIGGGGAAAYFRQLSDRVGRPPTDADFAISGGGIQVIPSREGLEVNVPATARALLRAATRPTNRVAQLAVVRALPDRTTADALAMGIDTRMSAYTTSYSGTSDRITNLQLGVQALDGTLVAPGGTFSLNEAIGERTEERGFRPAPVIIGNEYAEEVGGGTSQVATTVFNAAWEAGLRITERHPHSLYISRYQLGRDATVYWPSLDLKFVNDTDTWVLVKGFSEGWGITVAIFGGDARRVESSAEPLVTTGSVPVRRVADRTLERGTNVVEEEGAPPSRTSATREISTADGAFIRSETWNTSYESQDRVVRVGTKAPPPPKSPKPTPEAKKPATPGAPEVVPPEPGATPPAKQP